VRRMQPLSPHQVSEIYAAYLAKHGCVKFECG
jgi:hypothetical protein